MAESSFDLYFAKDEISALYRYNFKKHLAGRRVHPNGTTITPPPLLWQKMADRYIGLKDTILELGSAITESECTRQANPFPDTETWRQLYFYFPGGEESDFRLGQFLMADIFQYRVSKVQNSLDLAGGSFLQEAHSMLIEYGFKDGLLTHPTAHVINFERVVERILTGDIKLTSPFQRKIRH